MVKGWILLCFGEADQRMRGAAMATPVRGMSSRAVQAEQTRQQILETAQRLFGEIGYEATSIQMIADELSLTKAAVYYHFRAKADIQHALMLPGKQRIKTLLDEAEAIRGRRARIEYVAAGFADYLVQYRHSAATADAPVTSRPDPDREKDATTLHRRGLTLLFGESPTGAERLSYNTAFALRNGLADLTDLPDEELRKALHTTMLRILRVPS